MTNKNGRLAGKLAITGGNSEMRAGTVELFVVGRA